MTNQKHVPSPDSPAFGFFGKNASGVDFDKIIQKFQEEDKKKLDEEKSTLTPVTKKPSPLENFALSGENLENSKKTINYLTFF